MCIFWKFEIKEAYDKIHYKHILEIYFTLIALIVSELLYFLSSFYEDTLVLVVPVKT